MKTWGWLISVLDVSDFISYFKECLRIYENVANLNQSEENEMINKYFDSQWMQIQMFIDGYHDQINEETFATFFEKFITAMKLEVANLDEKLDDLHTVFVDKLFKEILGCDNPASIPKHTYLLKAFTKIVVKTLDIQFAAYDKFKSRRSSLNMEVTNSFAKNVKSFDNEGGEMSNDESESDNQDIDEHQPILEETIQMTDPKNVPEISLNHLSHYLYYDNLNRLQAKEEESTPEPVHEENENRVNIAEPIQETTDSKVYRSNHNDNSDSKIHKIVKKVPLSPETQIERNLQKLYTHYSRMQIWKQKIGKDFESYETQLNSMKLSEFLYFCEDFGMELSQDKIVNREELSTIFKLVATSTLGITFEKLVKILRHISKVASEGSDHQLANQLPSHDENSCETRQTNPIHNSELQEQKEDNQHGQESEEKEQGLDDDNDEQMMDDEDGQKNDLPQSKTSQKKIPIENIPDIGNNFDNQMRDEGAVSQTNLFEKDNLQSTIRGTQPEESLNQITKSKAYSRSRIAHKSKPISLHITKSDLDAQANDDYLRFMRSKGIHNWEVCKTKMRKPKGFVNLIERSDFARILEKNFKEQEAREKKYREQIQATHKSVFVGSANRSSDHDKSAFERLYELSKSMHKQSELNNQTDKTELRPLRKIPKRKKTFIKFDSYCAREQHKVQANFLQHISWEIINKMNSHDLAAQINGKLMAEKVKIKGVGKHSKENPLSTEINAFDNAPNEKVTQVKIKKILNYGKLLKQKWQIY